MLLPDLNCNSQSYLEMFFRSLNCNWLADEMIKSKHTTYSLWCIAELHNINFSLTIQYQLFYFPSYQYQYQYQLIQRGLININILSIIQKFPNQFQYQYQLIDSFINININISSAMSEVSVLVWSFYTVEALQISKSDNSLICFTKYRLKGNQWSN